MREQILQALPKSIRESKGCWVAGGFVRDTIAGLEPRDIDLFITKDKRYAFQSSLTFKPSDKPSVFETKAGGRNVQLITVESGDVPSFVAQRFDFVCCTGAIELGKGNGEYFHSEFKRDVDERVLRLNNPLSLVPSSILRILKLVARGWTIEPETMAKAIASIAVTVPTIKDLMVDENVLAKEVLLAMDHRARKAAIAATTNVEQAQVYVGGREQIVDEVRAVAQTATFNWANPTTIDYGATLDQLVTRLNRDGLTRPTPAQPQVPNWFVEPFEGADEDIFDDDDNDTNDNDDDEVF
jgi:hypothetical protein